MDVLGAISGLSQSQVVAVAATKALKTVNDNAKNVLALLEGAMETGEAIQAEGLGRYVDEYA